MAVVDVNDVRLKGRDRPPQMPPRPRVEPDLPGGIADRHAVCGHAPGQLAALSGDENLLEPSYAAELTS